MGARGTFALLVVLAGLAGGLWWTNRTAPDSTALTRAVLDGRGLLAAAHIEIRPDATAAPIELERGATGEWRIVEPVVDVAAERKLESLAGVFDTAQLVPAYGGDDVDDVLVAELGLDTPRAELRVRWDDGNTVDLEVGAKGPLGHDRFARSRGEYWRVQEALFTALQVTPDDLRERFVFGHDSGHVRRLRLDRRGAAGRDVIVVSRRGVGPWQLEEPDDFRLDYGAAETFVRNLLSLRVDRFQTGSTTIGPESVQHDVTIELDGTGGRETVTLNALPGDSLMYGRAEPRGIAFSIEARAYERLVGTPLDALRARWLISTAIEEAASVRIDPGTGRGTAVELARRGGGPLGLVQPVKIAADPTAVAELVQAFHGFGVREFVENDATDFAQYGLDEGFVAITVPGRAGMRPDVVHLGADAGTELSYARRADESDVVAIPKGVADILRRPWTDFVGKQILDIEHGGVVRAVLAERGPRAVRFARDESGRWCRAGAAEVDEDFESLYEDEELRTLRGTGVMAATALQRAPEPLVVTFLAAADRALYVLELHPVDEDVFCIRRDQPSIAFRLSKRDGRALLALIED